MADEAFRQLLFDLAESLPAHLIYFREEELTCAAEVLHG